MSNIDILKNAGFLVGERDPNMNRAFEGHFMVAEPLCDGDPYPTDDASDGRFCIVGNDLSALIAEAMSFFEILPLNADWFDNATMTKPGVDIVEHLRTSAT